MRFIGRLYELEELQRRYEGDSPELFIVYGRRRIGKSELLLHFAEDRRAVYYEASLQDETLNLRDFQQNVVRVFPDDPVLSHIPFTDWHSALTLLAERARNERMLVIIDEFPYLCRVNPALPSVVQRFWDTVGRSTRMFLVLCGSSVTFMEHEVLGEKSPLFGRRTGQLKLEGLPPRDSLRFSDGWPLRERLLSYGIFGNIPAYLSLTDTGRPLADLLADLAFKPTGFLYNEVSFLLQQELREPARYNSVLRAVAEGKTTINEIATISGCENTPTAARYLATLIGLGIVEKASPFFSPAPEKSRNNRYRIADNFIRFWYRFVLPNQTAIRAMSGRDVVTNAVLPGLDDFMGEAFENLCREYVLHEQVATLGTYVKRIGRHWDKDFDIDICAELGDGSLLVGECKWGETMTLAHLERLKAVAAPFARRRVRHALFAGTGKFTKELRAAEKKGDVLLVDGEKIAG